MRASVVWLPLWCAAIACSNEQRFRRVLSPPEVAIAIPTPGQAFRQGEGELSFLGTATDSYDGPDTLQATWVLDGGEPLPATFSGETEVSLALDPEPLALGEHHLELHVLDRDDQEGVAEVDWVLLGALGAPVVEITAPLDGSVFLVGEEITLRGQATDNNTEPDALAFAWSSSLDGPLAGAISGDGSSVLFTSALTLGVHDVTLAATDIDGLVGTATVALTVEAEPLPPVEANVGDLVFSEILVNPEVVDDLVGEWVELYNTSSNWIDLDGYAFRDLGVDSYTFSGALLVGPSEYFVLCASMDPVLNGGVSCDGQFLRTQYGGAGAVALGNNGDEVILTRPDGTDIDQVVYDSSWFVAAVAKGLDPALLNHENNDDETNWCDQTSVVTAGGEPGTPGIENDPC